MQTIKRKGKVYQYDYKTIYIRKHPHKELQQLAMKHELSMGDMIKKLITFYNENKFGNVKQINEL
jgi:hypothetical protein